FCSAGFQTCCLADFQIRKRPNKGRSADWEVGDTAGLETCVTSSYLRPPAFSRPFRCWMEPWFAFPNSCEPRIDQASFAFYRHFHPRGVPECRRWQRCCLVAFISVVE